MMMKRSPGIFSELSQDPALRVNNINLNKIHLGDGMSVNPIFQRLYNFPIPEREYKKKKYPNVGFHIIRFEVTLGDYQLFVSHKGYKTDQLTLIFLYIIREGCMTSKFCPYSCHKL